jgi:hypothetical protein
MSRRRRDRRYGIVRGTCRCFRQWLETKRLHPIETSVDPVVSIPDESPYLQACAFLHFCCMLAIQLSASWNSADFSVLLAGYRIKSVLLRPRLSFRDHLFPVVAGNSRVFSLFEGSLGRN